METVSRFEVKPISPEELENTIQELDSHVETVFNVEEAQQQFNELMRTLNEKRTELKKTIKTLEKTKDTLKQELSQRQQEEARLNRVIEDLEQEKASIEATVEDDRGQLEKVRTEQEKISVLMGSLKVAIEEMRGKLAEL